MRWLRANAATYRIDPNRIAVEGISAGAVVATAVAVSTDQQVGDSGNPGYSSKVEAFISVSGGLPGGEFVGAGDPAGLLFSGTADTTAPYRWSIDTANALSATGQRAVLYTEPGVGHVLPDMTVLDDRVSMRSRGRRIGAAVARVAALALLASGCDFSSKRSASRTSGAARGCLSCRSRH